MFGLCFVCCVAAECDQKLSGHFIGNESHLELRGQDCYTIANCVFEHISHSGSGGAVYMSIPGSNALIYSSIFFDCRTLTSAQCWGGALFLSSRGFEMTYTCARRCESAMDAHSLYFSGSSKSVFSSNTVVECAPRDNNGNINALDFTSCSFDISYFNSSFNTKKSGTGFYSYVNGLSSIRYSHFSNNVADGTSIIFQRDPNSLQLDMENVNIINSECISPSTALVCTESGQLTLRNSFIRGNSFSILLKNHNSAHQAMIIDSNIQEHNSYPYFITQNCINIEGDAPKLIHNYQCKEGTLLFTMPRQNHRSTSLIIFFTPLWHL